MRDWSQFLRRILPLLDFLLAILAFGLAYILRYNVQFIRPVDEINSAPFVPYLPYAILYATWLIATPPGASLYRVQRGRSWVEEVYIILNSATNATVVIMALSFLLKPLVFSRLMIIEAAVICAVLLSLLRLIYRMVQALLRKRGQGVERALIVGMGDVGRMVLRNIVSRPDLGYQAIGYLDDKIERGNTDIGRIHGYGGLDQLAMVLDTQPIDLVIVALPWSAYPKTAQIISECEKRRVQARVVPDFYHLNLSRVRIENLDGIPLIGFMSDPKLSRVKRIAKRTVDLVLLTVALPVLLALTLIISLLIRLDSPGPVFYRHRRVGENGTAFDMLKFRTMVNGADKKQSELVQRAGGDPRHFKLRDDPRRTRAGVWLRRTSLDELPNLINVVRGEMSLVGPRAPTPEEVTHYEPWHRQRLNVLPGMTGLWQVSGRSEVPFDEMCLMDIYYIENWSLTLDVQILFRTILSVMMGDGAY